jgi:hypothetical protein
MEDFGGVQTRAQADFSSAPKRLRPLFEIEPELWPVYDKLRRHTAGLRSSTYEITDRCNLRCEGCFFFDGDEYAGRSELTENAQWEAFFAAEAGRGINFAYLAGAEPSMVPDRLKIAAEHFPRGTIVTNGTRRIDPALPFRLHISLWGDGEMSAKLRGGDVFHKPLRMYAEDPRAVFMMTVSKQNAHQIEKVAEACAEYGVKLTFSHFSPPETYLKKLEEGAEKDDFFHASSRDDNMLLDPATLRRVREAIERVMERFPDTIVYSREYNNWTTQPEGLYEIDPKTGWALDCAPRSVSYYERFRPDQSSEGAKCCLPNLDCRHCRAYAVAQPSMMSWFRKQSQDLPGFRRWLGTSELWARINIIGWDQLD